MAQKCFRPKGDSKCALHPKQQLIMECSTCPDDCLVCAKCIATNLHKGHDFRLLEEVIPEKTEEIRSFLEDLQNTKIPQNVKELKTIVTRLEENEKDCADDIQTIALHNDRLKGELDKIAAEKVAERTELARINGELLMKYRSELEKFMREMERQKKETKDVISTAGDIFLYDTAVELKNKSVTAPTQPKHNLDRRTFFVPVTDPIPHLRNAFGGITIYGEAKGILSSESEETLSTVLVAKTQFSSGSGPVAVLQRKTDGNEGQSSQTDCQYTSLKISECDLSVRIFGICPADETRAWICTLYSEFFAESLLRLINKTGTLIKTLKMDVAVDDICLDSNTGRLYFCSWSDNSVQQVNTDNGTTKFLFRAERPCAMAMTSDANFVVGLVSGRVHICKITGEILYTFEGKLRPQHFSTSEIHIAVSYGENVVVLDHKLSEVQSFTGQPVQTGTGRGKFLCFSTAFVNRTDLLVADCTNKEIHVLDVTTGRHKQTILKLKENVSKIGIYQNILWVKCFDPLKLYRFKLSSM